METNSIKTKPSSVVRNTVLYSFLKVHIPKKLNGQLVISKSKDGMVVINNDKISSNH